MGEVHLAAAGGPDRDSFVFSALVAEQGRIRGMLRSLGVHPQDREDLTQEVLFAAWRAIEQGRYRPDPARDPSYALRAWLMGIAWRLANHYHGRAHRRREISVGLDPWYLAEEGAHDPAGQLEAREALRGLSGSRGLRGESSTCSPSATAALRLPGGSGCRSARGSGGSEEGGSSLSRCS
ncbi:sigma-70 family RNA polymerase sigma factor [Sorangium sp. So ce1389]|uniref:sigma-70 family RNA polymerase sigma factor n=1 Tax=Sorangium sp. So ce1389 TaxID=3133336 RepID=UPI003F61B25E